MFRRDLCGRGRQIALRGVGVKTGSYLPIPINSIGIRLGEWRCAPPPRADYAIRMMIGVYLMGARTRTVMPRRLLRLAEIAAAREVSA